MPAPEEANDKKFSQQ